MVKFLLILAKTLLKLLMKYQPESRKEKRERLKKEAEAQAAKKEDKKEEKQKKVNMVKYGLNHVTSLVENNKAQLVVIANNVEPVELVLHLPTLCHKKEVPYCFIKGRFIV